MLFLKMILLAFLSPVPYQASLVNIIQIADVRVEYGNVIDGNNSDGFIRIWDETDTLVNEIIYDNHGYDIFRYLAVVSETEFVIVCDTYHKSELFALPEYRDTVLLKFDTSLNLLDRVYLSKLAKGFYNHNYHLILAYEKNQMIYNQDLETEDFIETPSQKLGSFTYQYQGSAYINGILVNEIKIDYPGNYNIKIVDQDYVFEFMVVIHPDVLAEGIEYGEGFFGEVKYYSFGKLFLDSVEYQSGEAITAVGNHHLLIMGERGYRKDVFFTILPDIVFSDGIVQEQLYDEQIIDFPIRIYHNSQSTFLNGELYSSELISEPGYYELELFGSNEYHLKISFTIVPTVTGVIDNEVYDSLELFVFGDSYLNGQYLSGSLYLDQPGTYQLKLMLDNEVYQTINFVISEKEIVREISDYQDYLPYFFIFLALVGGVLILRKK